MRVAQIPAIPARVAVFHSDAWRLTEVLTALSGAGHAIVPLPPLNAGFAAWRERAFDLLIVHPYGTPMAPDTLMQAAKAVAGHRPVIALTQADCTDQRIAALQNGADDALFIDRQFAELLARVSGLLRRYSWARGQIWVSALNIDLIERRVARDGRPLLLPPREFELLTHLAREPDRVVARDTLLRAVWRLDHDPGTNRLEVHMSRLRSRIDRGFAWPMLRTFKGQGYALASHAA